MHQSNDKFMYRSYRKKWWLALGHADSFLGFFSACFAFMFYILSKDWRSKLIRLMNINVDNYYLNGDNLKIINIILLQINTIIKKEASLFCWLLIEWIERDMIQVKSRVRTLKFKRTNFHIFKELVDRSPETLPLGSKKKQDVTGGNRRQQEKEKEEGKKEERKDSRSRWRRRNK